MPAAFLDHHRDEMIGRIEAVFREVAVDDGQYHAFRLALPLLAGRTSPGLYCPAIHLPFLTSVAAGGDDQSSCALAAATMILQLSIELMDRVWDAESERTWPGLDPKLIQLTGGMLMAGVVPLALRRVRVPAARILRMQQLIAARLLRIAAGELTDLRTFGRADLTLKEVTSATLGKTGERCALYAALGAVAAGAAPEIAHAYDEMGRYYGYARQIASDLIDLWGNEHSRDLASGSRTWPLAAAPLPLEREDRRRFVGTLDDARHNVAVKSLIREELDRVGAEVRGQVEVETACQRALAALGRAAPLEPAAAALRAMIEATTVDLPSTAAFAASPAPPPL